MAKEVAVRVETSHVEWGPVFAGALAAAALSFVLLSAAASLGLSLISAYPGHSYAKTGGTLAALWSLIVTIGSFLLGGYIAGRLRSSWREASADEVAFRDGMHGFLVWSLGIVAGAFLVLLTTITTAQVSADMAARRKATPYWRPQRTRCCARPRPLRPRHRSTAMTLRAFSPSPSPTGR